MGARKRERSMVNVATLEPASMSNGPGRRYTLWVRGCSIRCSGHCINRDFASPTPARLVEVERLFEEIQAVEGIEGVTFTGGEPFDQATSLFHLARMLREKTSLGIMSYSGSTIDELRMKGRYARKLLGELDLLIDGPYLPSRRTPAPLLWRGSDNQRVIFLSPRYREYAHLTNKRGVSLELGVEDSGITISGNFDEALISGLSEHLERHGIILGREGGGNAGIAE